ncbi:putative tail fiber protein [Ditylenchus destructor]|nr:putative tail fiber protein [Ditylenchus destructor]
MQILKPINVGQAPNDQTGDTLRNAMVLVNENFTKTRSGVDAVEIAAAAAQRKADAAIPAAEKGAAGGVTPLDAAGKVPAAHLPEPAIPLAQKAAPGGVAPLDEGSRVPVDFMPITEPAVPLAQKGQPYGVATLAVDGKIDPSQLPALIPVAEKGRANGVAMLGADGRVPAVQLPAVQDAVPLAEKGLPGGVATLGGDGKVPAAQIPPIDSIPLGFVTWWPGRAKIPAGWAPLDGQTISRATYPDACAAFLAGAVPLVQEADWLADPTLRAGYTEGDGTNTVRLPDLNGKFQGSLGAVFLRGDGAMSAGVSGQVQLDQLQTHGHLINLKPARQAGGGTNAGRAEYGEGTGPEYVTTESYSGRVGAETRPLNATGCWVVKLAGAVLNAGQLDAQRLASDLALVNAEMQTLKAQLGTVLGIGQILQVLTAQRALGTNYVNNTGRPIVVYGWGESEAVGASMALVVAEGYASTSAYSGSGAQLAVSGVVPAGATYRITAAGLKNSNKLISWKEYR